MNINGEISFKILLIGICLGVWVIAFQNAGIIPTKQNVYIKGGYVNINDIDQTLDINLKSINGNSNAFYDFGGDGQHVRIPVMTTYPNE